MLYLCASVIFFIFALRSVFWWTYIWQINGYEIIGLLNGFRKYPKGKVLLHSLPYISFFLLIILYGVVILNDSFVFWYQLIVVIVISCSVVFFVQEVLRENFKRPVFSLKALLISLVTTFFISLLYMVPLVDAFLWLILLLFAVPILVSLLVALLSFPSELYEDYILQKAKEKMAANPIPFSVAIIGDKKDLAAKIIYSFSSPRLNMVMPQAKGLLPIMKEIKNGNASRSSVFIFEIPSSKEEMQKLLFLIRPSVIIATDMQEKKDIYKTLFHITARSFFVLTSSKNTLLIHTLRHRHKKVFTYGWQKSSKKSKSAIFGYDLKKKNKNISFSVFLPKEKLQVSMPFINEDYLQYVLPAVFLARKLEIPFTRIQKILQLTY